MSGKREGGCLCGAVRYEVQWPPQALVVCHCTDCQKQSGGAVSVVGYVARDDLQSRGKMEVYTQPGTTGQNVYRHFCPKCGSPILTDTDRARENNIIFFKAGTLDKTSDLAPTIHYWTQSAQTWLIMPEGVTCLEQQ